MKIATNDNGGMSVEGNDFKTSVQNIIKQRKFKNIIETGTYLGTGTTKIILDALDEVGEKYTMFSIEVNPEHYRQAICNLSTFDINIINGLSIPRNMLSTEEDTSELIYSLRNENIFVDYKEEDRIKLYSQECSFDVGDDWLNKCMKTFDYKPDLIILDSAGHMGFIEFQYVLSLLKGSCVFILDDVDHIKHHKSYRMILDDGRFNIIKRSNEKFGFCIVEYNWSSV